MVIICISASFLGNGEVALTVYKWPTVNFYSSNSIFIDAAFVDCLGMNRKVKPHSPNCLLCDVFIFLMVFSSEVPFQYCFS